MPSLIGNKVNQCPTNGDLGTLAFQDSNAVNITGGSVATTSTTLGSASANPLTINSSAVSIPNGLNFDSNTFVIDATNNRVGIGTASPSEKLTVSGGCLLVTGGLSTLRASSASIDFQSNQARFIGTGADASTYPSLIFANATTTTFAERMRIDSSGNVGIGINSGLAGKLHVSGANANNLGTFAGGTRALRIGADASEGTIQGVDNSGVTNYRALALGGGNYVRFLTGSDGGGSISERMRIDSSGNVGIGTSSPANPLHVVGSAAAQFQRTSAGTISLLITPTGTNTQWSVGAHSDGYFRISNEGVAERMRIDSSGNLLVGITSARANAGDVQVSKGISFPATQSAQSDANTLDDYEEGTFTPTAIGASTAGTTTYSAQYGYYTKIGRQVNVTLIVAWSALTGTGDLSIQSLPFSVANLTQGFPIGNVLTDTLNWSGGTYIVAEGQPNSTNIKLLCLGDDAGVTVQQCVNEIAAVRVTLTYFTST